MAVCASCGTQNPDGFRFCGACGAALGAMPEPREVRKTVTALFCDVVGSTALGERLDAETLRTVMARYFAEIDAIVRRHGGSTEKFIGDAAMAVFGVPRVQEDDALRAVRAAAEIRERLPALAEQLGVALMFRTGVNTGEVVVGTGQTLATGDAINVAARLQQAAEPGEILIGAATRQLVRNAVEVERLEPLTLKGKADVVEAFRLIAVDLAAPGLAVTSDAPLIGRERELDRLRDACRQAVDERVCVLFTLLGAAGVGKSRLAAEFLDEVGEGATIIRGRCLHYGEGITFWPLLEALGQVGEPAAAVIDQLSGERGWTEGEVFWEVRRLMERLAADRPLVAVFDDIQWAEPTLLDLLDHVTDLSRTAPILLLCLARPDLLDQRPGWAGGKLNATSVLLEPLLPSECEVLVDALESDLDPSVRARIVRASQGNPLFVAEMLALRREAGQVAIPPSIHALLAARIEQLGDAERQAIERAAVEGEVFHRGGVRDLSPEPLRDQLDLQLAALVRKELIRPDTPTVAGDEAYRFRHLLIRDAAYEALPKRTRAELHQRFADWLDRTAMDLPEYDEIAGWHVEQTVRYRRELGEEPDPGLASRAADHLAAAGRRAMARIDLRAADNLLTRALQLLPSGDARRPTLALDLAEALIETGGLDRLDPLLAEAADDPVTAAHATVVRILSLLRRDPEVALRESERHLPQVIEGFHRSGDDRALAQAYVARSYLAWFHLQARAASDDSAKAAEHARRAGDRRMLGVATRNSAMAMILGPADRAAIRERAEAIEHADLGPLGASATKQLYAFLARLEGRFDEARRLLTEGIEIDRSLGMEIEASSGQPQAEIELAAGNPGEAVRLLRTSCQDLERFGDRSYWATAAAMLADALQLAGETAEAERVAHEARAKSADDDLINFVATDRVLARIHLARGETAIAERFARKAVEVAMGTDFEVLMGDTHVTLACTLHAAGNEAEAREAIAEAIAHYERKGDLVGARRAGAMANDLGLPSVSA